MSCLHRILFHIKVLLNKAFLRCKNLSDKAFLRRAVFMNKAFLRRVVLLGVFRDFFRICSPLSPLLTFYFGFSVSADLNPKKVTLFFH